MDHSGTLLSYQVETKDLQTKFLHHGKKELAVEKQKNSESQNQTTAQNGTAEDFDESKRVVANNSRLMMVGIITISTIISITEFVFVGAAF